MTSCQDCGKRIPLPESGGPVSCETCVETGYPDFAKQFRATRMWLKHNAPETDAAVSMGNGRPMVRRAS